MSTQQTKHSMLSNSTQDNTNSMKQKPINNEDEFIITKEKTGFKSFRRAGEYTQRNVSNTK
jgi:hypothetical protein